MMKALLGKTYLKTIFREIQGTFSRFMAIFAIVALGVGFLAGLLATTPDMKISMDRYFDQTTMMDIFIKATMGLTDADADILNALDEVDLLLPAYVSDALVKTSSDEVLVTRIYGLPLEKMNQPGFVNRMELLKGRMPQTEEECVVQEGRGYFREIALGTRLSISEETLNYSSFDDLNTMYKVTEYTVTGIVRSPLHVSSEREPSAMGNGRLGMAMYVQETCYALSSYTDFYITVKGAAGLTAFTPAYQHHIDPVVSKIELLGKERSLIRHEEVSSQAYRTAREKVAEAEAEYGRAKDATMQQLAAVRRQLDAGAAEIAARAAELREAEAQLAEGRAALAAEQDKVTKELRQNDQSLRNGAAEIAAAKRTLAESKVQLDQAKPEVEKTRNSWFRMLFSKSRQGVADYDAGLAAYQTGLDTVSEKEKELQQGRLLLEQGKQEAQDAFALAQEQLDAAEADIAAGKLKLETARRKLAAGEAEYNARRKEAVQGLQDGEDALEAARQNVTDLTIPLPQWYVLDRNANMGYVSYKANVEKIADVAKVFPIFFLLIASLVALTTMTRMVEEERIQIGTLKALGYQKRTILCKYLIYCGLTGILGSAVGMVSGFQGLPIIIYNAFATMSHLPPLVTEFNWSFGLIACGLVLACTMGATIYACYQSLWEKPAFLMLPRPPKSGKRIFLEYIPFIWNSMKFTHKVTARNLIRQKKHFVMTITGIAGCTALIVAGFGLRDSMVDIAQTQFEEILKYDLQVELRDGIEQYDRIDEIDHVLKNRTPVHSESGYMIKNNERLSVAIMVPQHTEDLSRFITLRNRRTQQPISFSSTDAILCEKVAEWFNLKTGDSFVLENAEGTRSTFTLSGITENYVGAVVYLGSAVYSREFGGVISYRTLLANTGIRETAEQDRFITSLLAQDGIMGGTFTAQIQTSYTNLLNSIGFVVLVLIFAAGGLAMIVLYNLTNININERTREIATLRVLGFHQSEAAAYIFREITVLSILGAVLGLFVGIPLHRFIIGVAENVDLMFGRRIAPVSFVLSAVITILFSIGVDLCMLKKLRDIKMAASMKAAD